MSRNFYLQVGCKYTYFTFTSLSIYLQNEEERQPTLSEVGNALRVQKGG